MFHPPETYRLLIAVGVLCCCMLTTADAVPASADAMDKLVRQLNDQNQAARDKAEQELIKLAPLSDAKQTDEYLEALPQPLEGMPAEVKLRLARIRKTIETQQAEQFLASTKFTVSGEVKDLEELLNQVHQQTGNRLVDYRERFGQPQTPVQSSLALEDEPFWSGIDKLLDNTQLSIYPFSGEDSLGVVQREPNAASRAEGACYVGPFRVKAVNVTAQRDLRVVTPSRGTLGLEIAWEPRLQPIAITQPADDLKITAEDGSAVALANRQQDFAVEVQVGSHVCELSIPFVLPPRQNTQLSSIQGKLSTLVPGRVVEFRFDGLNAKPSQKKTKGGVRVTLQGVRKNQELWEVHMRLRVDSQETGLESHRGWVFQNLTYLLNKQGETIDHIGFETTMQSEKEIGFAYLFDLPNDSIGDYTWVYRTPAAIVRAPVAFELKDVPLP